MGHFWGPPGGPDIKNICKFGIPDPNNVEIVYNVVILGRSDHGALFGALLRGRTKKMTPDLESAAPKI